MQKNIKEFEADVEALLAVEVEIGAEKIPYDCLEGAGKISGLDLANMERFIEEPAKAPEKIQGGRK